MPKSKVFFCLIIFLYLVLVFVIDLGFQFAIVFVLKVCSLSLSVDGFFCFGARLFSLDSLEGWEYRNEGVELEKADNDRDNA